MSESRFTRWVGEMKRRRLFGVLVLYVLGAWAVLQVAGLLFPGWHIPDEAIRFVWIGAVLLFPVACLFSWFYDVSPQGIARTAPEGDAVLPLTRTDYGILGVIASITLIVVAGVAQQSLALREAPVASLAEYVDAPPNSIAVLPFVNMSDNAENEYFSDGITEQLLNELAKIPSLHVAARTSSFYFKGRNESMRKMGAQLGVRTLLEGSVRRIGNRVRVTAQLINAHDGYHLWSETYDRDLDDIFRVQDDIAGAIVTSLQVSLADREKARLDRIPTNSTEAFDLYLRAMSERRTFAADAITRSNALLEEATRLDPEFALAIDALAFGYVLDVFYGTRSIDDAVELAVPLLDKAIELQPDLEEAYASYGLLYNRLQKFPEANEHFETALRINPNYFGGLVNYGLNLVHQGRLKEASANYIRAQALDPLNANLNSNLGALLMLMGEPDEGFRFMRKAADIDPSNRQVKAGITSWMVRYGRLVDAVLNGRALAVEAPDHARNNVSLAEAYLLLGMTDEAKAIMQRADSLGVGDGYLVDIRRKIWAAEGDFDGYIEEAERAFEAIDLEPGSPLSASDKQVVYRYGVALIYRRQYADAAEHLYWAVGGDEGIAAITYDFIYEIKPLALTYLETDRTGQAEALLRRSLNLALEANANGWATPQIHYRIAEIHAMLGDIDAAAASLNTAFDKGWRGLGDLEYGIYWQHLQDNEAINAVKVRIIEDVAQQRRRVQAALFG